MVEREKWILYKHTSDYELIKIVALDVKTKCASNVSDVERYRMRDRLKLLNMYQARSNSTRVLDSINHRINTLEFFMFGYEENRKFIFSPLGNLFLNYIENNEKSKKIFTAMLFGLQFEHYANTTPNTIQLFPFRLLFRLMLDERLENKIYSTEYAYIIAFIHRIDEKSYEKLVENILAFRQLCNDEKIRLLKEDEHTYVNCIYEWQYYTQKLLSSIGIIIVDEGEKLCKLYHPSRPTSSSAPTSRWVRTGYAEIAPDMVHYINKMLKNYPYYEPTLKLNDEERMKMDVVKEVYSFYPSILLEEIGLSLDDIQVKLLQLPKLIEEYSNNLYNETSNLFEQVLADGFNMFSDVKAVKKGGPGQTDIECLYIRDKKKFAVEAKSTGNKLLSINAGRLRIHRKAIGGEYTIVVTPRYVPAARRDIQGEPIVIILASTFSEYLYNHIYHDVRDIKYSDFDEVIMNNLGKDVSKQISKMTMSKFATNS